MIQPNSVLHILSLSFSSANSPRLDISRSNRSDFINRGRRGHESWYSTHEGTAAPVPGSSYNHFRPRLSESPQQQLPTNTPIRQSEPATTAHTHSLTHSLIHSLQSRRLLPILTPHTPLHTLHKILIDLPTNPTPFTTQILNRISAANPL